MNRQADKQATRKLLLTQIPFLNFNLCRLRERRELPLTLGLSVSFFSSLTFRLILKKEDKDSALYYFWYHEYPWILAVLTKRLFKYIWKLKSMNMFDQFLSSISHTASLSSRRWPADFGFCSVFVPFLLFQSTSWNHLLILQHIKLFPQCNEHLFFSVPGVRNH